MASFVIYSLSKSYLVIQVLVLANWLYPEKKLTSHFFLTEVVLQLGTRCPPEFLDYFYRNSSAIFLEFTFQRWQLNPRERHSWVIKLPKDLFSFQKDLCYKYKEKGKEATSISLFSPRRIFFYFTFLFVLTTNAQ